MEDSDSDAHFYSKEEAMEEIIADLAEISDTESVASDNKTQATENTDKMKKNLLKKPKDDNYVKYFIVRGKKKVKIECYGTTSNPGNLIRCPYSGIRGNDRVGSYDENHYFKVNLPCISKGDNHMSFYYDTPEAFERHHVTVLSKEIKDRWYEHRQK